ncbi:hypothetical protein TrST_g4410 [Triparma strigata]|uniref:Uncharacterized protein n=1 Tax=Triparma strigata TaxID=1606541 RepID=A0A9W7ADZ0_9STRA|nr:hypothetical protein TrST_g4410 [Triparma strigata]
MYLISVPNLLKLDRMKPHQELLRQGALTAWNDSMRGRIIFVSHQWTAYANPDPDGDQLFALQQTLARLSEGETDVENDINMQLGGLLKGTVSGAEWKAMVPDMYVWLDFSSMAQPSAGPMPSEDLAEDDVTKNIDRSASGEDAEEQKSDDHRHSGGEVANCLNNGVASLPGYVELADFVFVLVPVVEHKDRCETCDFSSWRGRGWCRLELLACGLAPGNRRVIVVRGGSARVEFITQNDILNLSPGLGNFSCCAVGHDFGHGPVECDRIKIRKVLGLLLEGKIRTLFAEGKLQEARAFVALEQQFFRGLGDDVGGRRGSFFTLSQKAAHAMQASTDEQQASTDPSDAVCRLAGLQEVLQWSSNDQEKTFTKRTGMGLLAHAVIANDLLVVRHLLAGGTASSNKEEVNRRVKGLVELLGLDRMTPLMLAMSFSRFEIVESLLDAGADPTVCEKLQRLNALMVAAWHGRSANIAAWLKRFPEFDLERRNTFGMPALHIASMRGDNTLDTVRTLVDAGANLHSKNYCGATVLHATTMNLDIEAEATLRFYLERVPELLNHQQSTTSYTFKGILMFARFCARRGSKSRILQELARWEGDTPLAAAVGNYFNLPVARILCATPGIELESRNLMGNTPLDKVKANFGESPPTTFVELLTPSPGQPKTPGS